MMTKLFFFSEKKTFSSLTKAFLPKCEGSTHAGPSWLRCLLSIEKHLSAQKTPSRFYFASYKKSESKTFLSKAPYLTFLQTDVCQLR